MKKMYRSFLALTAVLLLGFVLTACGDELANDPVTPEPPVAAEPAPAPVPEPEPEGYDPVEISVWWWGGDHRHQLTTEAIELFQERYPHITVNFDFAGWADYWTMLTTAAAGNGLPTVMQMDLTRLTEFTVNNLIVPLNPFFADGTIDVSNVDMASHNGMLNIDGDYMAISLGANAFAMVYNTELAAELGLEFGPDLTWDEFADMMRGAKAEREDFYGFAFGAAIYELLNIYVRDAGYAMYGDGELGAPREVLVDFFTMVQELEDEGLVLTIEREAALTEGQSVLHHEIVISQLFASNQIVHQQNAYVEAELGLALLPRIAGGRGGNWIRSSMQFAITSQATPEEQAAGAKFINFWTNDLEVNEILNAERGAPISDVVRNHLAPLVDPVVRRTFDILPVVAEHASPADRISPAEQAAVRSYVDRASEALRMGEMTPEEAADFVIEGAEDAFGW